MQILAICDILADVDPLKIEDCSVPEHVDPSAKRGIDDLPEHADPLLKFGFGLLGEYYFT